MHNLNIDPFAEEKKITSFIKTVLKEQGFENVVIGMSGGIDSATSFSLLEKSIPSQNIFVAHLYYFQSQINLIEPMLNKAKIPQENIYNISIKESVDAFEKALFPTSEVGLRRACPPLAEHTSELKRERIGNIMARVRMTTLYDLAKKHNALVCGTENKSEFNLGYFTRFGDEASDFEPIQHLYKTQIYELAKYLGVSQNIIDLPPTAGLWSGQTDEGDFGFSYKEADNVLYLYFDKKNSLSEIKEKGFPNAEKIIDRAKSNSFKHHLPYTITS